MVSICFPENPDDVTLEDLTRRNEDGGLVYFSDKDGALREKFADQVVAKSLPPAAGAVVVHAELYREVQQRSRTLSERFAAGRERGVADVAEGFRKMPIHRRVMAAVTAQL